MEIAPVLIPHYRNRPLSMNPHPDGIHGKSFWQKDKPAYAPDWIPTFRYRDQKNEKDWILVDETATLAWLANHAVIDMHPWYSRVDKPEYPDWAVIDLDPAEGARFEEVVELARVVKSALDHLELKAVLKTTGQSGLHIYIPIERRNNPCPAHREPTPRMGDPVVPQARWLLVFLAIAVLCPRAAATGWRKNSDDLVRINKTLAGPYSARPVPGAPVSTPIGWAELDDPELRPNRWTIRSIGERLQEVGDLFEEALRLHQRLPRL